MTACAVRNELTNTPRVCTPEAALKALGATLTYDGTTNPHRAGAGV